MLFIVYGATLDLGYETREIFKNKNFDIIQKYNYVKDDAKVNRQNYIDETGRNEWYQKWYDDKVYVEEEELKKLDFTYELDGVCVGFNQKQIMDAVRGVKNSLLTIGASSLKFVSELKAAYGDYVTIIHLFEDVHTVIESVTKYGVFSDEEMETRLNANHKMQEVYLENKKIFDAVVLYTGEKSPYNLMELEKQYDSIIKRRKEIEVALNNRKYVALPYNGIEPYIFVSYAHVDREKVYSILHMLQRNAFRIWYDDGITWGVNWSKMIKDKIKNAECVILFSSQDASNSEYVQDEIIEAWTNGKKIYTVQLDNASFPPSFEKRLSEHQKLAVDRKSVV